MNPGNGQNDGESRLDNLEKVLNAGLLRNEAAHEEFEREHKRLLTAQVIFQDNLNILEVKMAETTDKLNALIELMNRRLSEPHPGRTQ
jgi:hypothetical protein